MLYNIVDRLANLLNVIILDLFFVVRVYAKAETMSGCTVLTLAGAMEKVCCKKVNIFFASSHIPNVDYVGFP